jgi:hypothetical protein
MRRLAAGGLAGIALSLVRGCVDGRLLRDCSRRELRVGDRGHGHGGGVLNASLKARGWDCRLRSGLEDALSCQARGAGRSAAAERGQATREGGVGRCCSQPNY